MTLKRRYRYCEVRPVNRSRLKKEEDEFERFDFARRIAEGIDGVDREALPFCIGLFGRWGSGKTVILNWVREELGGNSISIYVSAKEPGGNLLEATMNALAESSHVRSSGVAEAVKTVFRGLAPVLPHLVSAGARFIGLPIPPDIVKMTSEVLKEYRGALREFKSSVERVCGGEKKLVVIIDDLDRLPPTDAVSVLEEFEVLFGITPTPGEETKEESGLPVIFIVSVDPDILKAGLTAKYGREAFSETMARAYIAKHFQVIENVPRAGLKGTIDFIAKRIFVYGKQQQVLPHEGGRRIDRRIIEAATSNLRYFFQALAATRYHADEKGGVHESTLDGFTTSDEAVARSIVLYFFIYLMNLHAPEIVDWGHITSGWYKVVAMEVHGGFGHFEKQGAEEEIRRFESTFRGELREYVLRNSDVVRPLAGAINVVSNGNDDLVREVVNEVVNMTR